MGGGRGGFFGHLEDEVIFVNGEHPRLEQPLFVMLVVAHHAGGPPLQGVAHKMLQAEIQKVVPGHHQQVVVQPQGVDGEEDDEVQADKKPGRKSSPAECETCKNRKYQDGSNEMVSFKAAGHIDPSNAAMVVMGHEQEHVSNAYRKAALGGGEVQRASVRLETSICPECGRTYISGGETTTQIKYYNESNPYQKDMKESDAVNKYRGANVDMDQ